LGQSALAAVAGAAAAANTADHSALVDGLMVVRRAEFEVHGTSNSLIGLRRGSSGISDDTANCATRGTSDPQDIPAAA
jgi:hypothetical protein